MLNRTLICTVTALMCGGFGTFLGSQISVASRTQSCNAQPWGFSVICKTGVTPVALWQGGLAGLWTGSLLGAFAAGLATHSTALAKSSASGQSLEQARLELPTLKPEVLSCLVVLLALQQQSDRSRSGTDLVETAETKTNPSPLPELPSWAIAMAQSDLEKVAALSASKSLTQAETRQFLQGIGFSPQVIAQAEQIVQAATHSSEAPLDS